MNLSDITVCVGIDAVTIHQLEISLPTWKKNRPELWDMPWLVFQHGISENTTSWLALQRVATRLPTSQPLALVPWPPADVQYETQRERMVTGHVFAPAMYCSTPWAMKIDTDAIALCGGEWLCDEWFAPDEAGRYNAIIASPWGYTKAKGGGGSIEEWAIRLEQWGDAACKDGTGGLITGRLGLSGKISGSKIIMPRIASWLSIYDVNWLQELTDKCNAFCGEYRLPVPSQDTTAWYYAERMRQRICRTNMKRYGWTNVPHVDELRSVAGQVMNS